LRIAEALTKAELDDGDSSDRDDGSGVQETPSG
jgi:hypothetical protein